MQLNDDRKQNIEDAHERRFNTYSCTLLSTAKPNVVHRNTVPSRSAGSPPWISTSLELGYQVGHRLASMRCVQNRSQDPLIIRSLWAHRCAFCRSKPVVPWLSLQSSAR